jgi:tRNA/rRNA methyltransferase
MDSKKPIIVLVNTQMGENIGMCARAMLNCGLDRLRLVSPRDGWPNPRAVATAADADRVLNSVECFDSVEGATADCSRVFATTARNRARQIPAVEIKSGVTEIKGLEGECAILFGPEASGLDNEALSYADRLLDLPMNPEYSSLNLAQAVLLFSWEWWHGSVEVERTMEPAATKQELSGFLERLESELDKSGHFLSEGMKLESIRNLRVLFGRAAPSEREVKTLHGMVTSLAGKRKLRQMRADLKTRSGRSENGKPGKALTLLPSRV